MELHSCLKKAFVCFFQKNKPQSTVSLINHKDFAGLGGLEYVECGVRSVENAECGK